MAQAYRMSFMCEFVDIPSRLSKIEQNALVLGQDLNFLAKYFALVGFNTRFVAKRSDIHKILQYERLTRLIRKYNLKMTLDEKFAWISYTNLTLKLRIYHVALTYANLFIEKAAFNCPIDFNEENFWTCAGNGEFWCKSKARLAEISGNCKKFEVSQRETIFKYSSSRLFSIAILPLLTKAEPMLILVCALSIEVRKGPLNLDRFKHFLRECLRHVWSNSLGSVNKKLKFDLRSKYRIKEAELELKQINVDLFFKLWTGSNITNKSLEKVINVSPRQEKKFLRRVRINHLKQIETNPTKLCNDLVVLARYFCEFNAVMNLNSFRATKAKNNLKGHNDDKQAARMDQVLTLIDKYKIAYSPLIDQFSLKRYRKCGTMPIDGIARDHLEMFIDAAALSNDFNPEAETKFWRCANNFNYWRDKMKLAEDSKTSSNKCRISPNRFAAPCFYQLLTQNEPKLIELCSLRASLSQYAYVKHNIKHQIAIKLDKDQIAVIESLRSKYMIKEAEKELNPIDRDLFERLWALEQNTGFIETKNEGKTTKIQSNHIDILKKYEPNVSKLEQELSRLVEYFNKSASIYLLEQKNPVRDCLKDSTKQHKLEVQIYKLALKYHIIYSTIEDVNRSIYIPGTIRLHVLVDHYLTLFIDTAAKSNCCDREERRFWWCANNLSFMKNHYDLASKKLKVKSDKSYLKLAPSRLVSIGSYRLITEAEPKLLKLNALRMSCTRDNCSLTREMCDNTLRRIKTSNVIMNSILEILVNQLRTKYDIQQAELKLNEVDINLFVKRWNMTNY